MTTFALLLYPAMTQLDLSGPYEVFARSPDATVHLVWKDRSPVKTEHGLAILPTATFEELQTADVVCIPGGYGVNALLNDAQTIAWVRQLASTARFVTSVCTGALLLGAAGLLKDRRATTHWSAMEMLSEFGASPTRGRTVRDGQLVTGGGVTAGIDFALELVAALHGDAVAQAIQLAIEYNPAPPFLSGHPDTAEPQQVAGVRARMAVRNAERLSLVRQAAARLASEKPAGART